MLIHFLRRVIYMDINEFSRFVKKMDKVYPQYKNKENTDPIMYVYKKLNDIRIIRKKIDITTDELYKLISSKATSYAISLKLNEIIDYSQKGLDKIYDINDYAKKYGCKNIFYKRKNGIKDLQNFLLGIIRHQSI